MMAIAHPKPALREARHWHQLRKSWYIGFFQLPRLPERMLLRHDARGQRGAVAVDHRSGGFVAGGFDAEYQSHGSASP